MPKTLQIYAHNDCVGASSDIETGTFINDVQADGQMGIVVAVGEVSITSDALELMKTSYTKAGGSFACTMLTRSAIKGHTSSIAVMGFGLHGIAIHQPAEYGRDCDLTVLDEIEVDDNMNIPLDFIAYVDNSG